MNKMTIVDCWELLKINRDYWRLLRMTRNYWRLLGITGDYWNLLGTTGDYQRLLGIIGDYWRITGDEEITTYWRSLETDICNCMNLSFTTTTIIYKYKV